MERFLLRVTGLRVHSSRFALILVAVLASCSGGSNPSSTSTGSGQPLASATQTISAAAGGTLSLPSGETLVIPPGALSQDTMITMQTLAAQTTFSAISAAASLPAGYEVAGPVVELLPDGLTFSPNSPAFLTLPIASSDINAGSYLIYLVDGDELIPEWEGPEDAESHGQVFDATSGTISTPISHFSKRTVLTEKQMNQVRPSAAHHSLVRLGFLLHMALH